MYMLSLGIFILVSPCILLKRHMSAQDFVKAILLKKWYLCVVEFSMTIAWKNKTTKKQQITHYQEMLRGQSVTDSINETTHLRLSNFYLYSIWAPQETHSFQGNFCPSRLTVVLHARPRCIWMSLSNLVSTDVPLTAFYFLTKLTSCNSRISQHFAMHQYNMIKINILRTLLI